MSSLPWSRLAALLLLLRPAPPAAADAGGGTARFEVAHAAEVSDTQGDRVTICSRWPLRIGDRFALLPAHAQTERRLNFGVFAVDEMHGECASGRLPRGAFATPGDRAVPTSAPVRDRLLAPRDHRGLTTLRGTLRPGLAISPSGLLLLGDLAVDHRFRVPLRVGAAVAPFALLAGDGGTGGSAQLLAHVDYAGDRFEIGLGLGGAPHTFRRGGGLVALRLRAGASDGLHASLTFALSFDDRDVVAASLTGEFIVPLSRRLSLAAEFAASPAWGHGNLGLVTWLRGNGGPGTLLLHTAFGASHLRESGAFSFGVTGTGPALVLGLEWRR